MNPMWACTLTVVFFGAHALRDIPSKDAKAMQYLTVLPERSTTEKSESKPPTRDASIVNQTDPAMFWGGASAAAETSVAGMQSHSPDAKAFSPFLMDAPSIKIDGDDLEAPLVARVVSPLPQRHPWHTITMGKRPRGTRDHKSGKARFLASVGALELKVFFVSAASFLAMHAWLLSSPTQSHSFGKRLVFWLLVGCLCAGLFYIRGNSHEGNVWLCGYVLELIFSIENVFVFHVIIEAFRCPFAVIQKILAIVICCQVGFQLLFFVGLSRVLLQASFLPYVLGIWLVGVGVQTGLSQHDHFELKDSTVYWALSRVLGDRLLPEYALDGSFVKVKHGRVHMTMLAAVTACLLLVDFLFEVDVTLAKIEEFDYSLLNFTSSAVAAFAVPDLYFVAQRFFKRFTLMRFGICFVLVFYGVLLLVHQFVDPPPIAGLCVVIVVMTLSVLLSWALGYECDDKEKMRESAVGEDTAKFSKRSSKEAGHDDEIGKNAATTVPDTPKVVQT